MVIKALEGIWLELPVSCLDDVELSTWLRSYITIYEYDIGKN